MDTHVKVVGVLNIAIGALGLVVALGILAVVTGAAALVGASGDPDAAIAIPIIGVAGMAFVVLLLTLALPSVIIGIGVYRLLPWGRAAGIVLSILHLVWVPIGTIIGIYGLWVLFSKDAGHLFAGTTVTAPPVSEA